MEVRVDLGGCVGRARPGHLRVVGGASLGRSALRADFPPVLARTACRRTRSSPLRGDALRQLRQVSSRSACFARAAVRAAFLGAPEAHRRPPAGAPARSAAPVSTFERCARKGRRRARQTPTKKPMFERRVARALCLRTLRTSATSARGRGSGPRATSGAARSAAWGRARAKHALRGLTCRSCLSASPRRGEERDGMDASHPPLNARLPK